MNITLDNFRTQIGNQNYGSVVADEKTGALKTVNNGWFARHFSAVFATKTSVAQNQDMAVKLYRAVKTSVGNAEGTAGFLEKIAEQLGVQVDGENVRATLTTPLSRLTVKSVIMETDKFKFKFFDGLKLKADDLAMEMANDLVKVLNEEGEGEIIGREQVRIDNKIHIRPVYGLKEGFVPYAPVLDVEHGVQFLKDALDRNLIQNPETRSQVTSLLRNRERLANFEVKKFKQTADLAVALSEELGDDRLVRVCERVATGANFLKSEIWNDSLLLKYFREEIGRQVSARAYTLKVELANSPDDISTENLRRLVARQFERVIAQVADDPAFTRHSQADKTKDLATLCIESMSDKEFKLTFAA